jgi:hypothetical protein
MIVFAHEPFPKTMDPRNLACLELTASICMPTGGQSAFWRMDGINVFINNVIEVLS